MAMIVQILSRLSRVRITLGYAAMLIGVSAALVDLGPRARAHVIAQASTNLHNLAHGHLATLLDSAFVTDAGPMYFWLPCLVCLLALAELIWRSGRLAIVFVTGHIGATLLVAVGLTAAIEFGWLPMSVSRASDVGVSYGRGSGAGCADRGIPRRAGDRPGSAGGCRSVSPRPHWATISPISGTPSRWCWACWSPSDWAARPAGRKSGACCWRCPRSSAFSCWRTALGRCGVQRPWARGRRGGRVDHSFTDRASTAWWPKLAPEPALNR